MLPRNTVALPFVSGIQPNTRARLLDPQKLLTAENCQYILDQGPQRRNGHTGRIVRSDDSYPGLGGIAVPTAAPSRETFSPANPGLPATWLYGFGVTTGFGSSLNITATSNPYDVSRHPDCGQLFGAFTRDNEVVAWDGHRLFSYAPEQTSLFGQTLRYPDPLSGTQTGGPSCFPALRAEVVAKTQDAQLRPDAADNGTLRVAAWINAGGTNVAYSVSDAVNGAPIATNVPFSPALSSASSLRVLSCGPWFHMLVSDPTANSLVMRSFHQDTPKIVFSQSLGTVDNQFDVKKIDETSFIVAKSKAGVINIFILNQDGSSDSSFVPNLGGFAATTNNPLAVAVNEFNQIGLLWVTTGAPNPVNFAVYSLGGAVINARFQLTTTAAVRRLTLAPRIMGSIDGGLWNAYVEDVVSAVAQIRSFSPTAGTPGPVATKHRLVIASHAFRVGDRTFFWAAPWLNGSIGLQTTWFLLDASLKPVGKMDYGAANADLGATLNVLPSVNWHVAEHNHPFTHPFKDRIVYHGCLPFNQRAPIANGTFNPTGVFTEPSIRFYKLDFLPKLRAAQAGRTAYIAGAQLWSYDGAEVAEANIHMAPEGVTGGAAGGGSLSAGVYRYRVDLCYKNAQNEEVRSWSIVTAGITAALNDRITLSIPVMPVTRRDNTYFLIFRTEAAGTVFRLANSRDPSSANFVPNNQGVATISYIDGLADATLLSRESHPANSGGNYIDPLPAPACEIVAAGRDRLWLAGGELSPGEIAPSRLFAPGQIPTFSPALNIQVDRNAEPITAVGFIGDLAVIFRRTNIYVQDSDGPDNSLNGAWPQVRLAPGNVGCLAQETLAVTENGLWFQSPAGLRLLTNSGVLDPRAGLDVDTLAAVGNYSGTVTIPQHTQIRWYSRDVTKPTLVLDYSSNSWCTWTGVTCVGAVFWSVSNLAVLATGDGYLFVEDEEQTQDNGRPFEMKVKTSWLRAANLGDFQRFCRFGLYGKCDPGVSLKARIYYDERDWYDEEFTIDFPVASGGSVTSDFNQSIWGDGAWGELGAWGDDSNPTEEVGNVLWFRDGVFKFQRDPARQKCSVFAIEFADQGTITGGFQPVVLALELAAKAGLERQARIVS